MGRSTSCLLMELLHFRWLVLPRLHWGGGAEPLYCVCRAEYPGCVGACGGRHHGPSLGHGTALTLIGEYQGRASSNTPPSKAGIIFAGIFFFFFFELGEEMQVMLHFWYPGQECLSVLDARGVNSVVRSQQQTPLLCFWRKQKINK